MTTANNEGDPDQQLKAHGGYISAIYPAPDPSKNAKTLYYIQDAHDSLEAQIHIAKLIEYLLLRHPIKTVYEEGFEGPLDANQHFASMTTESKKKISFNLLDQLLMGGAEYAHINSSSRFNLMGADDRHQHFKAIQYYRIHHMEKAQTDQALKQFEQEFINLSQTYFPKTFLHFLKLQSRYNRGDLLLENYLRRIVDLLEKDMPRKDLVTSYPLIATILSAVAKKNSSKETWQPTDSAHLLNEMRMFEQAFEKSYLTNETEIEIYQSLKAIRLYTKLNELRVSFQEYAEITSLLSIYNTASFTSFIARLTAEGQVRNNHWEKSLAMALGFYQSAILRERQLEQQLRSFASNDDEDISIVVYGGFHQEAIINLSNHLNLNLMVLTPQMRAPDSKHQTRYGQIMSHDFTSPFVSPYASAQAVRPPSMFQMAASLGEGPSDFLTALISALAEKVDAGADPRSLWLTVETLISGFLTDPDGTFSSLPDLGDDLLPGMMLGIPLLDFGMEVDEGDRISREALLKLNRLLPVLVKSWHMKDLYLYGGLFEIPGDRFNGSGLSRQLHHVDWTPDLHFLRSEDGRTTIGYQTYDSKATLTEDGRSERDLHGNPFSRGLRLNPHLSDSATAPGTPEKTEAQLRELIETATLWGVDVFVDFIPWRAPEVIDESYLEKTFFHLLEPKAQLAYDAIKAMGDAEQREQAKRWFEESLIRADGRFMTQRIGSDDKETIVRVKHLVSDYGTPNVDEVILDPYNQDVQDEYITELKSYVDLGIKGVRVDLGHVLLRKHIARYREEFGRDVPDYEPWKRIIDEIHSYAKTKDSEFHFVFIMEVYDADDHYQLEQLGGTVYYKNLFSDLFHLAKADSPVTTAGVSGSVQEALGLQSVVAFASNFDQTPLYHFGISTPATLMLISVMAHLKGAFGLKSFVAWRDALAMSGDGIPIPGGDRSNGITNVLAESAHPHLMHPAEVTARTELGPLLEWIKSSPFTRVMQDLSTVRRLGPALLDRHEFVDNANRERFFSIAWEAENSNDFSWTLFAADLEGRADTESVPFIEIPKTARPYAFANSLVARDLLNGKSYPIDRLDADNGHTYFRIHDVAFKSKENPYAFIHLESNVASSLGAQQEKIFFDQKTLQPLTSTETHTGLLLLSADDAKALNGIEKSTLITLLIEKQKYSQLLIYGNNAQTVVENLFPEGSVLNNVFYHQGSATDGIKAFHFEHSYAVHLIKQSTPSEPIDQNLATTLLRAPIAYLLQQPGVIASALLYAIHGGDLPGVYEKNGVLISDPALIDALQNIYLASLVLARSA